MTIKKILVPTDFSATARKAALYAAGIAGKGDATVFLLHVIEPVTDSIRQPYPLHEKLQMEITKNRVNELGALLQSISRTCPSVKIEKAVATGTVTSAILDFAENNQMDLIVMGTKGATGLKKLFMGSVAAGTIGRSHLAVLAIPDEYEMVEPDAILFATNHFEENTDLLKKMAGLATLYSATIHTVVFVNKTLAGAGDFISTASRLTQYLDFLRHTFPSVSFKGQVLEGEEFEKTIEEYDVKNEVDIIAMVTYPKSFWERFMRKSETKKMAFHSKIPLLAIPAK